MKFGSRHLRDDGGVMTENTKLNAWLLEHVIGWPKELVAAQALGPRDLSGTWAGAGEVIETMRGLGFNLKIESWGWPEAHWSADFEGFGAATDPLLPMAVALAAKAAREHEMVKGAKE